MIKLIKILIFKIKGRLNCKYINKENYNILREVL